MNISISSVHVDHTPAKQVISRRRKNENVFKMSKNEKCTCKACKTTSFLSNMQICDVLVAVVGVARALRLRVDNLCFLDQLTLEKLQEKHFPEFENMCLKLDNGKRDYEGLAAKYDRISVDERESLHDERMRKGGSPSRELMSYIKTKYPNHPVVELIKNLKDIGRNDIALILKPLVKNKA